MELKNKRVTVAGLGKSGIAGALLLSKQGAEVCITENRVNSQLEAIVDDLIKERVIRGLSNVELGSHTERFIEGRDLVVVSPGVRKDSEVIFFAQKRDIPIISELELGYRFSSAPIIAVTGTSGKTTVTTLIGRVLNHSGRKAIVCGNIGVPVCAEAGRLKDADFAVVEVSSFQLEWIKDFRPYLSIILNISDNHLDRYQNMQEYIELKARLFGNQGSEDWVLLNGRDEIVMSLRNRIRAKTGFFGKPDQVSKRPGLACQTRNFNWNENFLAVASACSILGVEQGSILSVLSDFRGIEHRLEFVKEVRGVSFFNDSKATTISSVKWALNSLDGQIILIAGGRFKGGDFGGLKEPIKKKVRFIVAIGEARQIIRLALSEVCEVIVAESLQAAIEYAFSRAKKGDSILLSPGCSSFDMFRDYEERGRVFKETVLSLKAKYEAPSDQVS